MLRYPPDQKKSPLDISLLFLNECNFQLTDDQVNIVGGFASQLGHKNTTNPVDVAGWQGNQERINSSTSRPQGGEYIMWAAWNINEEWLRSIATDSSSSMDDVDREERHREPPY
jgi:hypothetical protein